MDGDIQDAGESLNNFVDSGSFEYNYAAGNPEFYIAMQRLAGTDANYRITLNVDTSRPGRGIHMQTGRAAPDLRPRRGWRRRLHDCESFLEIQPVLLPCRF